MRGLTIAAAVFVVFGVQVQAGTITQGAFIHEAPHGSNYNGYNQFDPTLGPLNGVLTTLGLSGFGDAFTLTNPTSGTISFGAHTNATITIEGAFFSFSSIVPVTLAPGMSTDVRAFQIPVGTFYEFSYAQTTNLGGYIGTGTLPALSTFNDSVAPDNLSIGGRGVGPFGGGFFDGSVTITYFFGPTLLMPEPASLVTFSLGLAGIAGLAWRRRKAA